MSSPRTQYVSRFSKHSLNRFFLRNWRIHKTYSGRTILQQRRVQDAFTTGLLQVLFSTKKALLSKCKRAISAILSWQTVLRKLPKDEQDEALSLHMLLAKWRTDKLTIFLVKHFIAVFGKHEFSSCSGVGSEVGKTLEILSTVKWLSLEVFVKWQNKDEQDSVKSV